MNVQKACRSTPSTDRARYGCSQVFLLLFCINNYANYAACSAPSIALNAADQAERHLNSCAAGGLSSFPLWGSFPRDVCPLQREGSAWWPLDWTVHCVTEPQTAAAGSPGNGTSLVRGRWVSEGPGRPLRIRKVDSRKIHYVCVMTFCFRVREVLRHSGFSKRK